MHAIILLGFLSTSLKSTPSNLYRANAPSPNRSTGTCSLEFTVYAVGEVKDATIVGRAQKELSKVFFLYKVRWKHHCRVTGHRKFGMAWKFLAATPSLEKQSSLIA